MNKGELIDAIASKLDGVTKKSIDETISMAIEVIEDAVAKGDKVTLVGFGSLEPRERKEREGRNPRTGETLFIPSSRVPAFTPGKAFKERVAG